jgi:phosphate transport system substrate-binding protein
MNIGTRIKDMFKGMWEDTRAVSPIVATLVLVVVAITGAAGVGSIMGTFSSDVADEAGAGDAKDASSTELLIAGSTTVQPVSELLATAYMAEHQGIKVSVSAGGSTAGKVSVGEGIVDIGAASSLMNAELKAKYPNIQEHQIGGSGVVVIMHDSGTVTNAPKDNLYDVYVDGDFAGIAGGITTAYHRAESSGTEETFMSWFGKKESDVNASTHLKEAEGNAGVLAAVQGDSTSIGFVDHGFAKDATGIKILTLYDGKLYTADETNITTELKDPTGEDTYPNKLTRPLNYLTNGEPSAIEQSFITFATMPGDKSNTNSVPYIFAKCGYFPLLDIV